MSEIAFFTGFLSMGQAEDAYNNLNILLLARSEMSRTHSIWRFHIRPRSRS